MVLDRRGTSVVLGRLLRIVCTVRAAGGRKCSVRLPIAAGQDRIAVLCKIEGTGGSKPRGAPLASDLRSFFEKAVAGGFVSQTSRLSGPGLLKLDTVSVWLPFGVQAGCIAVKGNPRQC